MSCRILMVCLGNICRSPTAQVVLRHKIELAGLGEQVSVDSAGTHAWQHGKSPDLRAVQHAGKRGFDMAGLRARGITQADFTDFDLILAMDHENLAWLKKICPVAHVGKLALLSSHAVRLKDISIVPDPYFGGPNGFEHVLDLVEDACEGLVAYLVKRLEVDGPVSGK